MLPINLKSIRDYPPAFFRNRKVVLRLDLNIPFAQNPVGNDFRVRRILPTIKYLQAAGARLAFLSHLAGRQASLRPVARYLQRFVRVGFVPSLEQASGVIGSLPFGGAILLDNIRRYPGEEKNSVIFSRRLAKLGEIFVNEAFSASHRFHSSIVGLPSRLPSLAGLVFMEEIEFLSRLFRPRRPFLVILGGVKFDTKLPLIKRFLQSAEAIFVGGALAHSFFSGLGYEIGRSLAGDNRAAVRTILGNKKIYLPSDVTVQTSSGPRVKRIEVVSAADRIVDLGPASVARLVEMIKGAKTVLWNGPLGHAEAGFTAGTRQVAESIFHRRPYSVVGGGDTVGVISRLGLLEGFSFVSTGGGAMLDFLARGTLPGIKALQGSQKKFGGSIL